MRFKFCAANNFPLLPPRNIELDTAEQFGKFGRLTLT